MFKSGVYHQLRPGQVMPFREVVDPGENIFLTGDKDAIITGADPEICYAGHLSDDWEIIGFGDFNNDGTDDLLIYNKVSGELSAWLVNNGTVSGAIAIA